MKVTCKKASNGVDYTYSEGSPEGNFDLVIFYKANSDQEVAEIADMLEQVSNTIRQWKYSAKNCLKF